MTDPPAVRPATQEAVGVDPLGEAAAKKQSRHVKVVNPVRNGSPVMRRKDAEHYVATGRGEFLGVNQFRLDLNHPKNKSASKSAADDYEKAVGTPATPEEMKHLPILAPHPRRGNHLSGRCATDGHVFTHVSGTTGDRFGRIRREI